MIKVAVYGFGNVGRHVVSGLTSISGVEIAYVVTKTPKAPLEQSEINFVTDIDIPLNNEDVTFIFECIDDKIAAEHIARKSLKKSKTLISCNKKLWSSVSRDFDSNLDLAILNSLGCNDRGSSAYPDVHITLSNINNLDQNDLYKFRGCDGKCAASVMIKDFTDKAISRLSRQS